ncbi:patatin-like phospholipase family protein [Litoreibacter roseus]|uniref:Alpha/beta hydrolase n=1 Tax=Litoreibacter roseus TaxID=2601869 RepID=A0A6N6JLA4_9RHOB|nr:patatin-like phospholipase family protein [Litoreibacter roseus]GFE66914.1 alpha/beta hydrolase [Litoreibacter roseus]
MLKKNAKKINLALQGGGAHGAFTWGVLDTLLGDGRIEIAGISGTSAGALNGAALKSGMLEGGNEGAMKKLDWLWSEIGATSHPTMLPWMTGLTPADVSKSLELSPYYMTLDAVSRIASPYAFGPLYENPLRRVVEQFSYDRVCALQGPDLYVCATNVRSGKIRIFKGSEISTDSILASGCLPTIFKAVEFHDPETGAIEAFWDGGYMGNPALFPLFDKHLPDDIVVVNINPLYRDAVPKSASDIQNRINEISFNGSLLRELRAIEFVGRLIDQDKIAEDAMKKVLVHMISDDALMTQLSVATKLIPNSYVLGELKEAGHRAAKKFLTDHFDDLNDCSSINLASMFA